jgi:hypothetical protein
MAKGKNISTECSRCGGPLGDRYMKYRYCKACHARYMRETRPKQSELQGVRRLKCLVRGRAGSALKRGKIKKQNCVKCGCPDSQMHHSDYSRPLDVTWLCRPCHLAEHNTKLKTLHVE